MVESIILSFILITVFFLLAFILTLYSQIVGRAVETVLNYASKFQVFIPKMVLNDNTSSSNFFNWEERNDLHVPLQCFHEGQQQDVDLCV